MGDILQLAPAQGCRNDLPAHVAWRAGTTTLCRSQLYPPQSGTLNLNTGIKEEGRLRRRIFNYFVSKNILHRINHQREGQQREMFFLACLVHSSKERKYFPLRTFQDLFKVAFFSLPCPASPYATWSWRGQTGP